MCPTTVSPLTVSVNRQEKEDLARYRLRARHEFSPTMIWIEHDMQLVRDLADKVLVLHYGKELALGAAESGFVRCRGDARPISASADQP